jgi:hypothetical protein
MGTKAKKEVKAKAKPKTKKCDSRTEEMEDRMVTAFYMVAKVVEQNTMMYDALITALTEASTPQAPAQPHEEAPPAPIAKARITQDHVKKVLVAVHKTCGPQQAKEWLFSYGVQKVSELPENIYSKFIRDGNDLIDGAKNE